MRSATPTRRGPSAWTFFLLVLLALLVGAAGTLGTLHALEIVDLRQWFVRPVMAAEVEQPEGEEVLIARTFNRSQDE
jgi:hypothetical protein